MKSQPGYPLPSGELGSDDIVCQLVYLPDRPEYWQAFYAALHYMTTWRAWDRDDDRRGKDAAANWRAAFELTSGCWRMTCLEQLQDDVAEILAIMQLGNPCCDEMDVTDGDQYTDRVEDGVGNVPQNIIDAGYASGTSDWAGFDDYKCMIVHVTVNQMAARLNELNELVNEYGAVAGSAAAIAAILAVIFATGGVALVFGLVAGVGAVSLLYEALMGFPLLGNLADKVDTNHDALACAMYFADGDVGALVALNDKIDELFTVPEAIVLKNLNNGPTLKALYAGRYDQQDIAEILDDAGYDVGDFDCSCLVEYGEYQKTFPFDAGFETWQHGFSGAWDAANGNPAGCCKFYNSGGSAGYIRISPGLLVALEGLSMTTDDVVEVHRIRFDYRCQSVHASKLRLAIEHDGTTSYRYGPENDDTWQEFDETFDPPLECLYQRDAIVMHFSSSTGGQWYYVDNVYIDYDTDAT